MAELKKQNLAFVDTETTGLNPDVHELIEIGLVLVSQEWHGDAPSFAVLEEFEIKIKPERIEDADPVSLRVNGYNEEEWKDAGTLSDAMELFASKTEGVIMVGHNVAFDSAFIEKAFRIAGIASKMHYHRLDTISIAFAKLHLNETIDKYSLHYLCGRFGIMNEQSHRALPDARATFALYKKLMLL